MKFNTLHRNVWNLRIAERICSNVITQLLRRYVPQFAFEIQAGKRHALELWRCLVLIHHREYLSTSTRNCRDFDVMCRLSVVNNRFGCPRDYVRSGSCRSISLAPTSARVLSMLHVGSRHCHRCANSPRVHRELGMTNAVSTRARYLRRVSHCSVGNATFTTSLLCYCTLLPKWLCGICRLAVLAFSTPLIFYFLSREVDSATFCMYIILSLLF